MCRAGGRRCPGGEDRVRANARRRVARNRARAAELRAAGDLDGAAAAELRAEYAAGELEDLDRLDDYTGPDPEQAQADQIEARRIRLAGQEAQAEREMVRWEREQRDRDVWTKHQARLAERDRRAAAEVARRREQRQREEARAARRRRAERAAEAAALQAGLTEAQHRQKTAARRSRRRR